MHRKRNVWAQRTIEFFDASQLMNKNRAISFRGMMFLFHENSILFPNDFGNKSLKTFAILVIYVRALAATAREA